MKNKLILAGSLSALAFLAGCQSTSTGPNTGINVQPAPKPAPKPEVKPVAKPEAALNGRWVPTDEATRGVYVAEFRDGVFVSRSPKTQKPLAKGSYSIASDTVVNLKFVGAATQTAVEAKCERRTSTTMYCVPTIGSPFNLARS